MNLPTCPPHSRCRWHRHSHHHSQTLNRCRRRRHWQSAPGAPQYSRASSAATKRSENESNERVKYSISVRKMCKRCFSCVRRRGVRARAVAQRVRQLSRRSWLRVQGGARQTNGLDARTHLHLRETVLSLGLCFAVNKACKRFLKLLATRSCRHTLCEAVGPHKTKR